MRMHYFETALMLVVVSAASGPTDDVDTLISASVLRLKGIHGQQAGSCQQQLTYCEEALSELSKAVKSQKAGLQDLVQHLIYALQLDMAECKALMVRPLVSIPLRSHTCMTASMIDVGEFALLER